MSPLNTDPQDKSKERSSEVLITRVVFGRLRRAAIHACLQNEISITRMQRFGSEASALVPVDVRVTRLNRSRDTSAETCGTQ